MSEHKAVVRWRYAGTDFAHADFTKGKYSREHVWEFDGGITIAASPSPSVVPVPYSNPAHVDPEEAFVAAVASCHMLSFLYVASKAGVVVTGYSDAAVGLMTKTDTGKYWVSKVTLRPLIEFGGEMPPAAELIEHLHHAAHEECYIANSIRTEVVVEACPA